MELEMESENHPPAKKSLTLNGMSLSHLGLILLSVAMVGVGLYLTKHFFQVHFSTDLTIGSACDISHFWGCDKAALSPLGQIGGVPLSVFGILFGVFLLAGSLFSSPAMEGTNYFLSAVNLVGCLFLLIYSLAVLKGLCMFCTVYYVLSLAIFLLFFKKSSEKPRPSLKILGIYGALTVLVGAGFSYKVHADQDRQQSIAKDLIQQFDSLPRVGDPNPELSAKIIMTSEKFSEAPIRLSFFSDFQCPACKMLAERVPKILEHYKGKVNIQYFYYPLDSNCNSKMKHQIHPNACEAAYLAACLPDKFSKIHDEIFENQDKLSSAWVTEKAKEYGVTECVKKPEVKEMVINTLKVGEEFKVNSTPTIILNGVKISLPPLNHLFLIFDEIIRRESGKT